MSDPIQGHPEPAPPEHRQGSEMLHVPDLANHATHDLDLIAAHAAGDVTGRELETAGALVAGCAECARLHGDLLSISAALGELPAPARPRDFRLTTEQAAALRPGGWRAWLATLAGPRFSFAAPLGTALTTLGLVGLLIAGPGFSLPSSGPTALAPNPAPAVTESGVESQEGAGTGPGAPREAPSAAPSAAAAAAGQADAGEPSMRPEAASSPQPVAQGSGSTEYSASPKATSDLTAGGEPSAGPSQQLDADGGAMPASSAAVPAPVAGGDTSGGSTNQAGAGDSGTTSRASDQAGTRGLLESGSAPSPAAIGAGVLLLLGVLLVGARLAARRLA